MWPCVFVSVGTAISLVVLMWWTYRKTCSQQVIFLDMFDSESDRSGDSLDEELVEV